MILQTALFWVLATVTGMCAISVVVTQNIVRSATWLLFTLCGTAGLYFLLGADFVGATQLLVYVGGTLVLVVFGVMLTAQGPFISMKTGPAEWAIALVVGLLLYGMLALSILMPSSFKEGQPVSATDPQHQPATSMSTVLLGESLLNIKEATPPKPITGTPDAKPPERARMGYLLPFEIVSIHLLVVLIGAAYLARAERRRGAAP